MKKMLLPIMVLFLLVPAVSQAGGGLGIRGGIESVNDLNDNLTHVGVDFRFGVTMVELIISGEYSFKKYDAFGGELTLHHFAGSGSLVYPFKLPVITPYVGGGVGSHTFLWKYNEAASIDDITDTKIGYHFIAGIRLGAPTMPIKLYGEYRHYWIKFEDETLKTYTLSGGILFGI